MNSQIQREKDKLKEALWCFFFIEIFRLVLTGVLAGAKISAYILRKQNVVPGTPCGLKSGAFWRFMDECAYVYKMSKAKNLNEGGIF